MNVAEFASQEALKSIKVPISYSFNGQTTEAVLKVGVINLPNLKVFVALGLLIIEILVQIKLQLAELQKSSTASALPRALSLRSFSCTSAPRAYSSRFQHPRKGLDRTDTGDWSSDGEPDFSYGKLAAANFFLVGQFPCKADGNQQMKGISMQQPVEHAKQQHNPSLRRLLSRNKSKTGPPLLNKESEDGGDDIDNDRRHQLCIQMPKQMKVLPLRFEDQNPFEVGKWEKKKIVSRDGEMELMAKVFFASIDQRSDKAAGGGACSVLATIVAHWLRDNPKTLPLRCQLDELVHEGSSAWRKLCENELHREKFADQHFDLETVLESKVRPLEVVTEKSYIGFFSLEDAVRSSESLQEATSFDSIWNEIVSHEETEERVYIASWNDHFFVLKVEKDTIYLIDTLGERLFEGCNQAYILKFDGESAVQRTAKTKETNECGEIEQNEKHNIVTLGMDSCKEYLKGFLAAVPLRELKDDIERGLIEEAPLHRRLQIEFHYTICCNVRN